MKRTDFFSIVWEFCVFLKKSFSTSNSKDILLFYHLKTRVFFSTQTLIDCYIWNEINIQVYFYSSQESTVLLSFTKYAFSLICSRTSVIYWGFFLIFLNSFPSIQLPTTASIMEHLHILLKRKYCLLKYTGSGESLLI